MNQLVRSLCLFALISLISAKSFAQKPELEPREEFAFVVSNDKIDLSPSSEKKVTISLATSKGYSKSAAQLKANPPAGITATFTPDKGQFETSELTLSASDQVKAGSYSMLVTCTINGKSKSTIVKINIP